MANKMYSLPDSVMQSLKLPVVDAPVAAISSNVVIMSEGEGGPKDSCDEKVGFSLKKF